MHAIIQNGGHVSCVVLYTLFQNGGDFSILLFLCKLALVASLKENILLNFESKNEAKRANLQENKEYLNGGHFGIWCIWVKN